MKEEMQERLTELQEQLSRGEIDRRQFLFAAALLGVSLSEALAGCGPKVTEVPATLAPAGATEAPAGATEAPAAATEPPAAAPETQAEGWGAYHYPYPSGVAMIETYEMKCVGCSLCSYACAMKHFGVMNTELSNIRVRKYLLPLPKSVQVTCSQCQVEERECEKACPVDPVAITFDEDTLHMVIDAETCLGEKCMQCRDACPSKAVHIYPSVSPTPFVCDLCDTENTGDRDPQCIQICPYDALYFKDERNRDHGRMHADEKAELISHRLHPMVKESMGYPEWDI